MKDMVGTQDRPFWLNVKACDDLDLIGESRHQRAVVTWNNFNARVAEKADPIASA